MYRLLDRTQKIHYSFKINKHSYIGALLLIVVWRTENTLQLSQEPSIYLAVMITFTFESSVVKKLDNQFPAISREDIGQFFGIFQIKNMHQVTSITNIYWKQIHNITYNSLANKIIISQLKFFKLFNPTLLVFSRNQHYI